jgi:hypothetical protein
MFSTVNFKSGDQAMSELCKTGEMLRSAWLAAVRRRVQVNLHLSEANAGEPDLQIVEMDAKKKWFDHRRNEICHSCFLS